MIKQTHYLLGLALTGALAACSSGPPYTPNAGQANVIDTDGYAPKVDAFAVILDVSSSMGEEYQGRPKLHTAEDLVASFNATIPPLDFDAGLVTFGKDTGWCTGKGVATNVYGMTDYSKADFAGALNSVGCAGGTTPMAAGIDAATSALSGQSGEIAVVLVSDFKWIDAGAVMSAVGALKAQHGNKLCLHTVKVGDYPGQASLIGAITETAGCDSSVNADSLGSGSAMAGYVTDVLLSPLEYETYAVGAQALFDFDKSDLKAEGMAELRKIADLIKSQGDRVGDIDVIGHTDSKGSEEYNQRLSERRAKAVTEYLVSLGIDGSIIDTSGRGELQPAASNDTEAGRARNRRVEVHVGGTRYKQGS
jgi:OOP family OmpA-OmpF porin